MNATPKRRLKEVAAGIDRRLHGSSTFLGLRHPFCGSMQTVMLLYHRVLPRPILDQSRSLPQIVTPLDDFEAQLDFLAGRYHLLSMKEFEEARLKRRALPLRTAVITFDDGWEDNYTHAFPALKQRGIPATIFLSTATIGTGRAFWQEQMVHLLQVWRQRVRAGEIAVTEAAQLPPALAPVLRSGAEERETLRLIESLKGADDTARASLINTLALKLRNPPFPSEANAFMNWSQVCEMQVAGIEFGSHAQTHRLLPTLPLHEIAGEVRDSRKLMEDKLGAPVTTFAYPNGNYSPAVIRELKAAGYRLAATTRRGLNTAWTNPFELRRVNVNGTLFTGSNGRFSPDLFAFRLTGMR